MQARQGPRAIGDTTRHRAGLLTILVTRHSKLTRRAQQPFADAVHELAVGRRKVADKAVDCLHDDAPPCQPVTALSASAALSFRWHPHTQLRVVLHLLSFARTSRGRSGTPTFLVVRSHADLSSKPGSTARLEADPLALQLQRRRPWRGKRCQPQRPQAERSTEPIPRRTPCARAPRQVAAHNGCFSPTLLTQLRAPAAIDAHGAIICRNLRISSVSGEMGTRTLQSSRARGSVFAAPRPHETCFVFGDDCCARHDQSERPDARHAAQQQQAPPRMSSSGSRPLVRPASSCRSCETTP